MHIAAPSSWTPLGIIRWIATGGTLFFGTVIAEENIRRFAEEKHWNELLTKAVAAMPDLSPLTESHWTWFIFGLFAGIALALWVTRLFSDASKSVPLQTNIEKSRLERDFPTSEWDKPLTPIYRHNYKNETVPLDGKNFIECTFENVTFLYQGTRGTQMFNCKKIPEENFPVALRTDNPIVFTTLAIVGATGVVSPIELDMHIKDEH
jgi:hypothetical protein